MAEKLIPQVEELLKKLGVPDFLIQDKAKPATKIIINKINEFANRLYNNVQFPTTDAQIKHIFRPKANHIPDTVANRQLIKRVASTPKNYLGHDQWGNAWFAEIQNNGSQVWVRVYGNIIDNAGINVVPRQWNNKTGLYNP